MKKIYFVSLYLILFVQSCNFPLEELILVPQSKHISSINGFDISNDDKEALISIDFSDRSSIYRLNMHDFSLDTLIPSNDLYSYAKSNYSLDGKHILFVEYKNKEVDKSRLCISLTNGGEMKYLTEENGIITEAFFSEVENEIIFCKANEFKSYSPFGSKSPHKFDIYKLNIYTLEITRLTELKEYFIGSISEINSDSLLFELGRGPFGGMFLFSKKLPKKATRYTPVNNPRKDASMYTGPVYSKKNNLVIFLALYEMYKLDVSSKKAELICRSVTGGHISKAINFNTSSKILFTEPNGLILFTIGLDGKGLVKTKLNLEEMRAMDVTIHD